MERGVWMAPTSCEVAGHGQEQSGLARSSIRADLNLNLVRPLESTSRTVLETNRLLY